MTIAKAGEAWESSQQLEFYSHDARKGSENCGHLAEPGSENCPTATRFPTMQLVPPDDGCEDARRPTGRLRDDPLILVLMMGSLRTSQAAGGFTITPHTPGVQCCTKRGQAEKFDRILVIWCSRLIKPNVAWSSWPRKTFFPHPIFHGARLCRLGVEWDGSVIKTDFNPKQPSFL